MDIARIIGIIAAASSAIVFFPQVIKTIKTRETKNLSLGMYIAVVISNACWISYGFLILDPAILLAQVFLFPMSSIILIMKLRYG
jgi:MtN3 and saliva related transmembrane protein